MLQEILEGREDALVERWLDYVLAAYPADGSAVFKRRTDRFANPVGHTSRTSVEALYRSVVRGDEESAERTAHLENVVRIRAVQEMAPSEAVGWVLELKRVIRAELEARGESGRHGAELRALEVRIDDLALEAFDLYVAFREELARLKVKEARRHVSWIVDRLNGDVTGDAERTDQGPVSLPIVEDTRVRGGVSR
ncbi:MAG: RsbRD N-terminal domain-containing protein [Longimicrobiales bacterium]